MGILESKFTSIMSKSSTDVGQTNLHTLDVQVTEGSPVFVKQYTIPLKYQNFIDDKTKRSRTNLKVIEQLVCTMHGHAQETRLRQTK